MTILNSGTVGSLPRVVAVPAYDRSSVTTGIVHIGVGGFHRAHEAMYLDQLMNSGLALDWGLCGVGVLTSDSHMRDVMIAQDGLYTLVMKDSDGTWEPRVIGSIGEFLYAPDDPDAVIEKMAAPSTRIVSLTITEGGYNIDSVTGEFDLSDPGVISDLKPGDVPVTVFGLVTEALSRRQQRGTAAFTVMSCDNIPGNGDVSRAVFTTFATALDPALGKWISAQVCFPNSMVDRITPQTTPTDRDEVSARFGVNDQWPVLCEPFAQWVLEDSFSAGRPPWDLVGVQLVDEVAPYELMKLRLLNAGHQVLCYPGYLLGYRVVHEAAQDPLIARFLLDYMRDEAIPTLLPVPGIDLQAYCLGLIERFSNPEVRDTVARLCFATSDRIPKFLLPVIRDQLSTGGPFVRSAAVLAFWARYAEGIDDNGETYEIEDARRPQLVTAAARQRQNPLAFLQDNRAIFGELADHAAFTTVYSAILRSSYERGIRKTLADLDTLA